MRIQEETIKILRGQGIEVRWYPEKTREEFEKRVWQEQYDYSYNYSKDHVRGSKATEEGRANILFDTMEEFEASCRQFADQTFKRHCDPYEYDTLYISHDNGQMLVKKESVKSKLITLEYILKLVEKNRKAYEGFYGKFAMAMQRLCEGKNMCIYPTTYGIGVLVFYNFHAKEDVKVVEKIMKERSIEYYNEYSEHGWVYRFKVSKKRENMERICA